MQGFVLIWPAQDPEEARRLSAEIADTLTRFAPGATVAATQAPAIPAAN